MTVTILLAFAAGLASFLSPCVFALVPAYIGYLSGRSAAATKIEAADNRMTTFIHGLFFVLGFSIIFILLGVAISALAGLLKDLQFWIAKIGGVVVIILGLHMTGLLRIQFLEYDLRPQSRFDERRGFLSSFMMGIFFSAGWSPCVGPVLGAILTLAANDGSIANGVKLLSAYSVGMAIPFLIAAVGVGWVTFALKRFQKALHYIEVVMGVVLIIIGVMLFLGIFEQLARFGIFVDFGL